MRALAFSVCLTSLLVGASLAFALPINVPGKAQTEKKLLSIAAFNSSYINNKKNDSTSILKKSVEKGRKPEKYSSEKARKLLFRVEPITKPTNLPAEDSAYLLVPVLSSRQNKPVVWKLRLIYPDSSGRKARDYRLILDSPENLVTEAFNVSDSSTSYGAYLRVIDDKDKAVPVTLTNATKVSIPAPNVSGLKPIPNNSSSIWQTFLFWGSGLAGIFCLLWATSRFLVFTVSVKPDNTVSAITEKNRNLDATIIPASFQGEEKQIQEDIQLPTDIGAPEENLSSPAIEPDEVSTPLIGRYFSTEILLTAGPRKKYMSDPDADKDLGEDACGMVANHQQLLLWVLDGTSDQYCLHNPVDRREYFSSRLLAQGISNQLRLAFDQVATTSLDVLLLQAVQAVKSDWLRQIQALPSDEQAVLRANIEQKNIPECATTLLISTLSVKGDLTAYRSGDCKMVLYTTQSNRKLKIINTPLSSKNDNSNDRLFFRLVLNPRGELDIQHNTPKYEIIKQANVPSLIAFTDGIGLESEALLNKPGAKSFAALREEIVYHLQGTADDKAICFIQIKSGKE
ncbi:hypothetical protein AHMF7605_01770 [Adhaeribacter arboris]|uniref:PPM-type phosphatase domain-containing protein n=1 Tax=Adhaeribacter arboris TaxID=2072846 RepID=A0A2T2YA70_9BACT|nr:protein phosphatase 2C domain-containing protein [Adhaeribacter arboris]PSR52338.1 hypothetical protein AHMF7605_01770 [Adhaeribacter arboris]